jgi:predicted flap endonuclease-1-like 5' DNA nuclease
MWPFCLANSPLWLLLPFLIGLLTGWWAWGRRPAAVVDTYVAPPVAAPLRTPVPTPAPEPVRVAPVVAPVVAALTAIGIPAAIGKADDLLQIKGVGPALNTLLNSLGVFRFDQIAAWGVSEINKVDDHLGSFKGRIERDSWVEQAKLLATGAIAEFERRFGTLDSENKK